MARKEKKKKESVPRWLALQLKELKKRKRRRPRRYPPDQVVRDGAIWVWEPDHPRARGGRVAAQDLVMEKELGRHLERNETVIHVNRNKKDNRPENLHLCKTPGESAVYKEKLHARLWEFLREHGLEDTALSYLRHYDECAEIERVKREGMAYVKKHEFPHVITPLGFIRTVMPGSGAWFDYGFDLLAASEKTDK